MDVEKTSIIEELDRISASNEFHAKPVMKKMLAYLVTEYVEGRSDQIKGYSVGLDVFGQGNDFDPARTAVVRNNAVRLRNLLTSYYLGEGKYDPVRIDIPKGKYVPHISRNGERTVTAPLADIHSLRPGIAVLPFSNRTADPALDFLATGFSQELTDALTKFDDLRTIGLGWRPDGNAPTARFAEEVRTKGISFFVDGDIQAVDANVRIRVRLLRSADNAQLWGDSFKFNIEKDDLFDLQEKITGRIASQLGGEYGHVNQSRYQTLVNSRARTFTEQDILLKQYHYVAVLTDEATAKFQEALFEALAKDPESALLNAIAGGFYGHFWVSALPGADEALQKFVEYTEKAYVLNPHSQWVLGNLGTKCFLLDERDRFFRLFEEAKGSMANSPLRQGAWAMHICLLGDWERGKKLLDQVFENNVHVPLWLYGATCLYHYRLHDYEAALIEANKFQIPGLFWGPAYRTAVLAQLGRLADAEKEFESLLECRPDFVEKGRFLMGCYIKETSLLEHVFEGLAKIGVKIE